MIFLRKQVQLKIFNVHLCRDEDVITLINNNYSIVALNLLINMSSYLQTILNYYLLVYFLEMVEVK